MRRSIRMLLLAVCAASPSAVLAQDTYTWNVGAGTWDTSTANWTGVGTVWANPTSPPDIAQFGGTGSAVTATGALNAGQLVFNSNGYTVSGGTITLIAGGTITAPGVTVTNATDTATISSALTGTAGFTASGAGTTILSGTNTLASFTATGGATLRFSNLGSIGTAPVVYNLNGGRIGIDFGVSTATTRTMTVTGASNALDVPSATTVTLNGVISGTGGFAKTGAGTLVLAATNTYAGATSVTGGVLRISTNAGLGATPAAATPNNLVIDGGTLESTTATAYTLSANRGVGLGAGTNTFNITASTVTIGGIIANSGASAGGLVKTGAGTLVIGSASTTANTFTGTTTVTGGTLRISSDLSLGALPGAATPNSLVVNGGTLESTINTSYTINSLRGVGLGSGTNTFNITGSAVIVGGIIANQTAGVAGGLVKTGGGVLTLSGANTFTGPVVVSQGVLRSNSTTALGNNTTVTIQNGGYLDVAATLSSGATAPTTVTLANGAIYSSNLSTNSILNSNGWALQNGVVAASLGGTNVTKSGLGTVSLLQTPFFTTSYAYTSGLGITGGALYLPSGSATVLGTTANAITINGGALVFGSFAVGAFNTGRTLNLGASATNVIDGGTGGANTIQGNVVGATGDNGFHKTGLGTFAFSNTLATPANAYSGTTTVWAGDFRAPQGTTGLPNASALMLSGGVFTLNSATTAQTLTRNIGTASGQLAWQSNADGGFASFGGASTVNLGGSAATLVWGSTPGFISGGRALVFGSSTSNNSLSFQNPIDLNGATRTIVANLGTGADTATLAGGLIDSGTGGAVIKHGGGTLVIPTATYTGNTTIASGTLQFGTLPAGNIALASGSPVFGGVLQLSNASATTITPTLGTGAGQVQWTGSGGFAATGGGALSVNINGNAVPSTLVWGTTPGFVPATGTLVFGSPNAASPVTLLNPVDLNSASRTISVIGGTATATISNGSLTKAGAGTLALGTGSTVTAGSTLTISGGTLDLNGNSLSVADVNAIGSLTATGGGSLSVSGTATFRDSTATLSAPITGAGTLLKSGINTLTVSSALTHTGPTILTGTGRLLLSGSALNTSSLQINGTFPQGTTGTPALPTLGGTMVLSLTNGQDRLNTPSSGSGTLPVTMNGGSLVVSGTATAGVTSIVSNFAALTLGSGSSNIYLAPNAAVSGQSITLNFSPATGDGLVTGSGSSLLVAGSALGTTTKVLFSGALPASGTGSLSGTGAANSVTVGVLRGVVVDTAPVVTTGSTNQFSFAAAGTGFATYDATNGVRALVAAEYENNPTAPTANANVRITSTTALAAPTATTYTINSLNIVGNTTGAVGFTQGATATTLNISSGNVLIQGGNNSSGSPSIGSGTVAFTLAFGANPAVFTIGNGTSSTTTSPAVLRSIVSAILTGTGGLVKNGPGIMNWSTGAGSSTITGPIVVNGGVLQFGSTAGTIGVNPALQPIVLNGGALQYTASSTSTQPPNINTTLSNNITLGPAGGIIDYSPGGGSAGGGGAFTNHVLNNSSMNITGVISGPGSLTKTGPGGLILQANNTYSGGTVLAGGVLVVSTVATGGTATLLSPLGATSTTAAPNALTLSTGMLMIAGSSTVSGSTSFAFANPVNLDGESTHAYVGSNQNSGLTSGFNPSGNVPAALTLSGPMTLTGTTVAHTFTNNVWTSVGGYSLTLSGAIGEARPGLGLIFAGASTSVPANSNPNFTPLVAVPTVLTGTAITGVNTYTGQTVIRQGMVNPNASVLAGQNGPLGNSVLPIVLGDPGGGTFAGLLFDVSGATLSRNVQLQMAGSGTASASAVAPVYLGTVTGRTGGLISGNIQTANRTLALFSGAGTLAAPLVVSGTISGDGAVSHASIPGFTNTVTSLAGANTYTGGTSVTAGTLLANNTSGSATGTGPVSVSSGATLGGSGSIAGNVQVGGTLAPGNSTGILTMLGNLTLDPAAALTVEITGGTPGTGYDQIVLAGTSSALTIAATAALNLPTPTGTFSEGSYLTIVKNDTGPATTGTFAGLPEGGTVTALAGVGGQAVWGIYYNANVDIAGNLISTTGGNDVVIAPVPEPATAGIGAMLGCGLLARRRRRSRVA